jgi:hypothetical protein
MSHPEVNAGIPEYFCRSVVKFCEHQRLREGGQDWSVLGFEQDDWNSRSNAPTLAIHSDGKCSACKPWDSRG